MPSEKKAFYNNKVITIKQIAPGIPRIPTIIDVIKLSPMWKPHIPPIKLIANMSMAPNIELKINLIIHLIGTIKILPIINKKHMHAKKITIFSISYNSFQNGYYIFMKRIGQICA